MDKTKLAEKCNYEDCKVRRGPTRCVLIISSLVLLAFFLFAVIFGYHYFGFPGKKNSFHFLDIVFGLPLSFSISVL